MAFYKEAKDKPRQEKREAAEKRGGFEDEGTKYSGRGARPSGERRSYGSGAPRQGGFAGGAPRQGGGPRREGGSSYGNSAPRREGGSSYGNSAPRREGGSSYGNSAPRREGGSSYGNSAPRREGGSSYGNSAPRREGSSSYGNSAPRREGGSSYGNSAPRREGGSYGNSAPRREGGNFGSPAPRREGGYGRPAGGERTTGFRDQTRATPRGERPEQDRSAPRDFRKSGNYRFSNGEPSRYNERGSSVTPRPYNEQRRARTGDERPYDSYRYDAPVSYEPPTAVEAESELVPNENLLSGRNPIREALKSGRDIEKLMVSRGELSGSAREIVQMAQERHIPVQEVDRARLDAITRNHQGMLAFASAYQYSTVEEMLDLAQARNEAPFLVLLDGITDPHNLGAIIRTAECAGAHGVIVQERRAVGLTPAAVKASAGAVEHLPVARVTNLTNTIETLKARNIWIYAADMGGEDYRTVNFEGAIALVIGAEGEGVSRLVLESCDKTVSLPLRGKLESLNASVAAGILLYAAMPGR